MTTISRRGFCRALAGAGAVAQMSATARGEEKAQTIKLGVIGCGCAGAVTEVSVSRTSQMRSAHTPARGAIIARKLAIITDIMICMT